MTLANTTPVVIYVTYVGKAGDRFDRAWFVDRHLPLVMESWARYGLQELKALFPTVERDGTVAICECLFRDEAAVDAAFGSPEARAVMDDVPKYTDIAPQRVRAVAL